MYRINDFDLILFLKKFRILLDSGYPVVSSLEVLEKNADSSYLKSHLSETLIRLRAGKSFFEAFFNNPHPFPIGMERSFRNVPETDVNIANALKNMEISYSAMTRFKKGIKDPSTIILLVLCSAIICFILGFVVSSFKDMYIQLGGILPLLPLPTRIIFAISKYWFIIPFFMLVYIFTYYRNFVDRFNKPDQRYIFSQLKDFLNSGTNINQALVSMSKSTDKLRISEKLQHVARDYENGVQLSESFRRAGYPSFIVDMLAFGERKGDINLSMKEIISYYTYESRIILSRPLYFVIIAIMLMTVGFIVISLYLPIFRLITD